MFTKTESALNPEYCKYLWETYKTADSSHEDWWRHHKPRFNTHRDRDEDLKEEWIEMFQIPIDRFMAESGYNLQEEFPIKPRITGIYINRYPTDSYLKWHTDKLGHRVCVIYLNPEWDSKSQGGIFEYHNEYWDKHLMKQRRALMDSKFYEPSNDKEVLQIKPKFNRAVFLNSSDCGVLHRTTPILGPEPKLSLLIAVTETVYRNDYTEGALHHHD